MTIDDITRPAATPTKEQLNSGLRLMLAVAETIREVGEAPSGTIYAALMDKVSYNGYMGLLASLQCAGLIEVAPNHMIKWVGPNLEVRA